MMLFKTVAFFVAFVIIKSASNLYEGKNTYTMKMTRAEILSYSKKYIKNLKFEFSFYNRTSRAINTEFDYLQDVDKHLRLEAYVEKKVDNVYKNYPALNMKFAFCDAYRFNLLGIQTIGVANGIPPRCPFTNRHITLRKVTFNNFKPPSLLLEGTYRFYVNFTQFADFVLSLAIYGELSADNN